MSHSTLITDYLGTGVIASRPAAPNLPAGCTGFYLASDTGEAALWNGASWIDIAGTQTITLGTGISQTGSIFGTGTLTPNYRGGTLTTFHSGITLTSGTLVPDFQAGTLTSFGTGLTLSAGVLTPNWQAAIVSSVSSTQLQISGGVLSIITNPTVIATAGTAMVVNTNSSVPAVFSTSSFTIVGPPASNSTQEQIAVGGIPVILTTRINGTVASQTGIQSGDAVGQWSTRGHNGGSLIAGASAAFKVVAINTWGTADTSRYTQFFTTHSGSTNSVEDMRLSGGVLMIGTTVAAGSELLRIAGITNTASLQVNGGSITSAFSPRFSWSSGTIDVIDAQGTLTLSGTTTGTVTPASNSSFLVNVGTAAGTIAIASGSYNGQKLRLEILQGATAHTVGFDVATVAFGTDITSFIATASANARDYAQLVWNGTKWNLVAVSHGYT